MRAFIMFFVIHFSFLAWGLSSVPECQKKPEFLTETRTLLTLRALPEMVFVGKSATYYVEDKVSGLKMWGEQSFTQGKSQIICATAGKLEQSRSFSMYAPTLIDLKNEKKIGDSYWQFHMVANSKQFGVWNQKSRVASKIKDLDSGLLKMDAQIHIFQVSHDEYEMLLTKENETVTENLMIRFDAVSNLK